MLEMKRIVGTRRVDELRRIVLTNMKLVKRKTLHKRETKRIVVKAAVKRRIVGTRRVAELRRIVLTNMMLVRRKTLHKMETKRIVAKAAVKRRIVGTMRMGAVRRFVLNNGMVVTGLLAMKTIVMTRTIVIPRRMSPLQLEICLT